MHIWRENISRSNDHNLVMNTMIGFCDPTKLYWSWWVLLFTSIADWYHVYFWIWKVACLRGLLPEDARSNCLLCFCALFGRFWSVKEAMNREFLLPCDTKFGVLNDSATFTAQVTAVVRHPLWWSTLTHFVASFSRHCLMPSAICSFCYSFFICEGIIFGTPNSPSSDILVFKKEYMPTK